MLGPPGERDSRKRAGDEKGGGPQTRGGLKGETEDGGERQVEEDQGEGKGSGREGKGARRIEESTKEVRGSTGERTEEERTKIAGAKKGS